jgi:hypothetical protein
MSEKTEVIKEKIGHTGVFSFKGLYSFMHEWLKEQENYVVKEDGYSESITGNKKNITFKWLSAKQMSDYFKVEIEIKAKISDLADVEAEIDGEVKKTNKGKVEMEIKGVLNKDPASKWDSVMFYRFLRDVYDKYIIPSRVNNMEDKVMTDVVDLKEQIKAFLEIEGKR